MWLTSKIIETYSDQQEYPNLQRSEDGVFLKWHSWPKKKWIKVTAQIYPFNTQSQRMFLALGFQKVDEEWYEYKLI